MTQRYYQPEPIADGHTMLGGSEAHHLLHVMRAKSGDAVTLFDGWGGEYAATVLATRRSEVELEVGPRQEVSRELPTRIIAAVALPKGDRQKWLVDKLTELGVTTLLPLETERSVATKQGKGSEKLDRSVIEAAKQCGRNVLMEIAPQHSATDFFSQADGPRWIAHPEGPSLASVATGNLPAQVTFAIGPEGGFSDAEVELAAAAGWKLAGLGKSILRIETAAVAMASWFAIASQER